MMGCGGAMVMRKKLLLIFFIVVLVSVAVDSEVTASSRDLLEQIILKCGLSPSGMQSVVRNLDFSVLHGMVTDSSGTKLNRKFVNEDIHEKRQSTLPNCQSKHVLLHVSGEDIHRNQYSKYLTSLFGWYTLPRRHLGDQPNSDVPPTLAPSPTPAPVPVSVLFADHGVKSPSYSPLPSSHRELTGPSASPTFNAEFSQESEGPSLPPKKHKNSKSSVAIIVVVTAVGTSVLAALLLFCCKRCLRNKFDGDDRLKDEGPLLALSMSDFFGSSHRSSMPVDAAIQKDKIDSLSFKIESTLNGHIVNLDGCGETLESKILSGIPTSSNELPNASSNDIASVLPPLPPLKPPPGRKVASTPPPPPAAPPSPAFPSPPPKPKPGPPPPPPPKAGPPPPPPPKSAPLPPKGAPPRPPQAFSKVPHPSPHRSSDESSDANAPKTKLKPLFWDKVSTNTGKSMVWNDIKSGSFQFNEEMIETLFGYRSDDKGKNENKKASSSNDPPQYIQLLEPKKSQNLAISLKAMSVKVDEFRDALIEGNELPAELLQTLLRMIPTTDEESRLRLYTGDPSLLGPGEQFLKAIMDIPFAFKRMDSLLFMTSLQEDVSSIKESFSCLEVASKELRNSRLFLKLLEAVLKLGNRMNDGTFRGGAQAFKLDTLLKLSDVKGTDGKTTLLHFVVQEIIRSEGARAVRMAKERRSNSNPSTSSMASDDQTTDSLEESEDHYRNLGLNAVSFLSTELENVKKAAGMDADALSTTVASLGRKLVKTKDFLNTDMKSMGEESGFHQSLKSFVEHAEADISLLLEEEKRVRSLVKSTTDYFHGNSGRDEGLRLFVIVRDFLGMLDKTCKEVRESQRKVVKTKSRDNPTLAQPQQRLFPAIRDRRVDSSSSDDEGS